MSAVQRLAPPRARAEWWFHVSVDVHRPQIRRALRQCWRPPPSHPTCATSVLTSAAVTFDVALRQCWRPPPSHSTCATSVLTSTAVTFDVALRQCWHPPPSHSTCATSVLTSTTVTFDVRYVSVEVRRRQIW